jgi:hypothetical protein
MSELTTVAGRATSVSGYSHTSGHVSTTNGNVSGSVSTTHTTCLRIGNVPVRFRGTPQVSEGDTLRVVGYRKAELAALALQNDTTGAIYSADGAFASAAAVLIVLGIVVYAIGTFVPVAGILRFFANVKLGQDDIKTISLAVAAGLGVLGVLSFIRKRGLKGRVERMLRG